MILVAHRINTIDKLKKLDKKYGVEIDIRDKGKNLFIVHDPFKKGILLKSFLKHYDHKLIIANIKSERIEDSVIKIFNKLNIKNYFFLDSSFPKIIELTKKKIKKVAIRVSCYENKSTAKILKGKINWIWYDTFDGFPKNFKVLKYLKKLNYKICLVCPKLHKKDLKLKKNKIDLLKKMKLIDAVCTKKKFFFLWR